MSLFKPKNWYKIADTIAQINFSENGMTEITVGGKKVCIALHNKKLFACATHCPHAGGTMSDGYIDALGNIVCPLHRYKFSLQNGRNTSGEGFYLKTFPLEIRSEGIFIEF